MSPIENMVKMNDLIREIITKTNMIEYNTVNIT